MKQNLTQKTKITLLLIYLMAICQTCEKDILKDTDISVEQNIIEYGISREELMNSLAMEKIQRDIINPNLTTTLGRKDSIVNSLTVSDIIDRLDLNKTFLLSQDSLEVLSAPVRNDGNYKRVLLSLSKNGVTQPYLLTYPDSTDHKLYYVSTLNGILLQKTTIQDDGHGVSEIYNQLSESSQSEQDSQSRNGGEMCSVTIYQSCSSGNHSFASGNAMQCTYWNDLSSGTPPTVSTLQHPCPGGYGDSGSGTGGGGSSGGNYDGFGIWIGGGLPSVPPKKGDNSGVSLDDCVPYIDCEDCNLQGDLDNNCYIDGYETCLMNGFDSTTCFEFREIIEVVPNAKFERLLELKQILNDDPWALIQDCAEQNGLNTQSYLDLYNLPFPQECSDRLFNMGVEWHHQPITDGNVPLANIDYYGVEVTNYPDFNSDGNSDTEAEIYQAFREKFIDVASGDLEDFQFSCNILFNTTNTGDISWEFVPLTNQDGIDFVSNDPISSILLIEADASGILPWIATDDGAVMVSDFTNNDWTISTIMTPNNGTQPFSGNRQWGWLINQNGNFEFFTRAVDVANISILLNIAANTECQQETYYDIAEATWKNMQQEIVDWINSPESNGGQASISTTKAIRVEKEKIEELLTRHEAIDQINCN